MSKPGPSNIEATRRAQHASWTENRQGRREKIAIGQASAYLRDHPERAAAVLAAIATSAAQVTA